MIAVVAALGLVIGVVLGLLGAGGSILAVPALVYGGGVPMAAAVPAALAVVGVSALAGLPQRVRAGLVRWPIAGVFGVAGLPAAFAGAAVGRLLPERWLMAGFTVLMTVVAVRMFLRQKEGGGACRTDVGSVDWRHCLPRALLAGAGVGLLTGLFGVGGGFVIVPALTLLLGLSAPEAVATSLVVVMLNSAWGLLAHAGTGAGAVNWAMVGAFAAAATLASLVAGRIAPRVPAVPLRRAFATVVLLTAAAMAATLAM
ncbi:sulfite exporter TauE/SafE family protein [Nonomuraea sp. NBC_01738]|uniref:sulfite exporter TauE/SafE family protein n=1 Tax=Nonomuraea sp. NBC_01738 TaxID=2976003 RepID=UPI002E10729A|nr:sulfite exporter TauE/SafE family protein [Nonomuraea sp. NBC_01738]